MRTKFDKQLATLKEEMIHMGSMVEQAIEMAISALAKQDIEKAKKTILYFEEIEHKEKELQNMCFQILLSQHPVASDLRMISSAIKMINDMKRIGEQAGEIAEISIYLADEEYIKKLEHLTQMAKETTVMVINSIEAFVQGDVVLADKVIRSDDIVDDLFVTVKKELIRLIHENPSYGEQATDLLMIAKYFEKIGDHAVNIAEKVIFAITGKEYEAL
ncbi:MAG: phosphate signaling complex protein PhoU [Lachnospiraceae bacterium]|nr:phosphate signaling complex protein PhoU [Lachnospiraceae bacterium]